MYRDVQWMWPTKTYAKYEVSIKLCCIIKPHSIAHCQNCHCGWYSLKGNKKIELLEVLHFFYVKDDGIETNKID